MARRRTITEWPAWRYGPNGESAVFDTPEEVPADWYTTPQQAFNPPEPKPVLCATTAINKLQEVNIKVDPRWGTAKLWEEVEKVCGK